MPLSAPVALKTKLVDRVRVKFLAAQPTVPTFEPTVSGQGVELKPGTPKVNSMPEELVTAIAEGFAEVFIEEILAADVYFPMALVTLVAGLKGETTGAGKIM